MEDYRVRLVIHEILSKLVVCLVLALLTPAHTETSEVFNSPNATVALTGDNVILPCSLRTPTSLAGLVVEWSRSDLKDTIVHINREGRDIEDQNLNYRGRTSMFPKELKNGNISLKLNSVKISDSGQYTCDVPSQDSVHKAVVQLVVGAVSHPVISIVGPKDYGVVLKCDSGGWYPEPEMTWLDSDGNILPDGPTETETDSVGRYTVRGHVTIQKTDNNMFTCKVLQQKINHKMETQFYVPDETFPKSRGGLIAGVTIAIVVAVVAGGVGFFMWRMKKKTRMELSKNEEYLEKEKEEKAQLKISKKLTNDKLENTKSELKNTKAELKRTNDKLNEREAELKKNEADLKGTKGELERTNYKMNEKEAELKEIKEELTKTKAELNEREAELKGTKGELEQTNDKLKRIKEELKQTNDKLNEREAELKKNEADLKGTKGELEQTNYKMNEKEAELKKIKEELTKTKAELNEREAELKGTKGELEQTNYKMKEIKEELTKTKAELNEKEAELKRNEAELMSTDEREAELKRNYADLKKNDTNLKTFDKPTPSSGS